MIERYLRMLTTSHLNSTAEENDLSTFLIIPFDSIKNSNEFTRLKVLPDGTLCLINSEDEQIQGRQENVLCEDQNEGLRTSTETNIFPISQSSVIQSQLYEDKNVEETLLTIEASKKNPILPAPSEIQYNCIKCEKSFSILKEYKDHLKWHKLQKKFKCNDCSAGYNIENNLKIHQALIHPKEPLNSCPICGISLTFQRAASLNSHLMVHFVEELTNCENCDEEIEKEDEYAQHMLTHILKLDDDQPLICSHCDVEFKTKQQLKVHMSDHAKAWKYFKKKKIKKAIPKEKKFNCEICSKSFIKLSLLERHVRIHSGEKPFRCEICEQRFTQKGTLQIHLLKHTGNRPFACTLCPARFNQKGNLRVHINKTHTAPNEGQKMFKCPQCSCIFKRIASLNGHVTKAHLKNKFNEENLIDDVMKNLKDLEEPSFDSYITLSESTPGGTEKKFVVQMKKIGEVKWYKCSYCPKMCKKPSDLIRHLRVHTKEKPFVCKTCKKTFSLKSTLMSHMNTHNQSAVCNICNCSFDSKRLLNIHIRKHENEKLSKWRCITCDSIFDNFDNALKHKMSQGEPHVIQSLLNKVMKQPLYQTVYGNLTFKPPRPKIPNVGNEKSVLRPFHCTICDARFTKKINLKRHIMHHEGDRKFKCQYCPKAFITSYRLKEHLNFHNNIKNYACKVCNKRFGTSTTLRRHMITHNKQKPYMCPYCSEHFQTLDLTRRHIKNVHKKEIIPNIEEEIEVVNNNAEDEINNCQQPTSVIITNKIVATDDVSGVEPNQQIIFEDNIVQSELLNNPIMLQDSNTGLQTFYVNLEDLQLINNSGLNLSNLVENEEKDENIKLTTNEFQQSDVEQPNSILGYSSGQDSINIAAPITSDLIFDENTIIQPSTSEGRTVFDDASIICMICNKIYSSFIIFQKHTCIDTNKDQNSESFMEPIQEHQNKELTEKKIATQPNDGAKKMQCQICKKVFKKKILYKKHLKIHLNLQCSECNQVFEDKNTYLEHMTTHNTLTKVNLHDCEFCKKRFKKTSDLTRHIRTHTGEKPFNCEICDKKFSLKSTLQTHIRTHDPNHKEFGCHICNTFFSSKSSLKVHLSIHTGQMPYSCSICKAEFRTLGAKKSHEARGHVKEKKKQKKVMKNNLLDILKTISEDIVSEKDKEEPQNITNYVPLETLNLVMTENNLVQSQTLELSSQVVNLDLPQDSILPTIPEVQLPEDSPTLLQQLQMSDMVLTTNETENVPSLILDDVSFLDLNAATNNLQIISLPDIDTRVKENTHLNEIQPMLEKTKSVQCDICQKYYASKDGLRRHKKKVHGEKKTFNCDKCEEKFDSKDKLQEHKKDHYICEFCALKFTEEKSLKNHMERYHGGQAAIKEQTSALVDLKLDLSSSAIDEPLFSNLFTLKKL